MVAWGTIDRASFAIEGPFVTIATSKGVDRGFCGQCGSSLTYANELRAHEIDVTLASLDDPASVAPIAHIWIDDKLPWVKIADGLPQYRVAFGMAAAGR
jgi:hypothetical protein